MIRVTTISALVLAFLSVGAVYNAWSNLSPDYELFWMPGTERVTVENGGLTQTGEIRPIEGSDAPLIVFLHPSRSSGRKGRLTQMLLGAMSSEFPVASFDLRGYGESEGHPRVDRVEQLDFVGDLRAWLDLYRDEYGFDRDRIVLVGHSTGAGTVIHYMAEHPDEPVRAALIIPIYPEKLRDAHARSRIGKRWEEDMRATADIDSRVVHALTRKMAFAALPGAQHGREVLIIDTPGAYQEGFPHEVFERLAGPRRLYQATQGDHHLGTRSPAQRTASRYLGQLGLVHRQLMVPVVDEIARLARSRGSL